MVDLHTPELRAKLPRRREPYWVPIQRGCALGYRRGANGGTWIVRWRLPNGRKRHHSLGEADDGGYPGLSYDDAQELAMQVISGALAARTKAASDAHDAIDKAMAGAVVEAVSSPRFKPPPIDLAALARDLTSAKRLYDSRLRRWRPSRTVVEALRQLAASSREPRDQLAALMADTTGRDLLCWGWSALKAASADVLGAAAPEATLTRIINDFDTLCQTALIAHRIAKDASSTKHEILDINIEYDLIGRVLPGIYERHFRRRFGVSRKQRSTSGSKLTGPGVRFITAAAEVIRIMTRDGRPYDASVILDALATIRNSGAKKS
jgi:hypothetical protein